MKTAAKSKPAAKSGKSDGGNPQPAPQLKPLGDKLLIRQCDAEEKTESGIILPDIAKEKPQRGTILAIGPGKLLDDGQRIPIDAKTGDEVVFVSYAATTVKIGGEDLLVVPGEHVLGVVERSDVERGEIETA